MTTHNGYEANKRILAGAPKKIRNTFSHGEQVYALNNTAYRESELIKMGLLPQPPQEQF